MLPVMLSVFKGTWNHISYDVTISNTNNFSEDYLNSMHKGKLINLRFSQECFVNTRIAEVNSKNKFKYKFDMTCLPLAR
jgi:hypothetical protein